MNTLPLHIEPMKNGGCLSYLVADPTSGEALLVDPKIEDFQRYITAIKNYGYKLTALFDTHSHADHITATPALKEAYPQARLYRHHTSTSPCQDIGLHDGESIPLGTHQLRVQETFGHTTDHLVLHAPGAVFTGDTLLLKTCGRTDFPGGDPHQQWETLQSLFELSDDTVVYPGHDYKGMSFLTMKEVKAMNERYKLKSVEEFVEVMANLGLGAPEKLHESLAAAKHCDWQNYAKEQNIDLSLPA